MKRIAFFLILPLLLLGMLSSCARSGKSEPEQVYLVSAIGFDGDGETLRLSVEVPLTRESEADKMETKLFTGEGETVDGALRCITAGLAKELIFSHCALMVLGDGLSREQLEAAFEFGSTGAHLPLAAQVIASPDAEALLKGGSLSSPAAGYDIPGILKQESALLGLDIRCGIYELRANASPERPIVLPYVRAAEEDAPQTALFAGLRILRAGMEGIPLSPEESVYYAILCDRFKGTYGMAGSFFDTELSRVRSSLTAERHDGGLHFTLSLRMDAIGRVEENELADLQHRISSSAQAMFDHLKAKMPADLCFFSDRLAIGQKEVWAELASDYGALFPTATLTVTCEIEKREEGSL